MLYTETNNMSQTKTIDLLALIIIVLSASSLSLIFQLNFLSSTILFLGIPSIYLAVRLRTRTQWRRIITMALVFGVWHGYIFAYIANWNRIWAWPNASLPWGWLMGVNPVEWLWVFLWITFIVLFYEHFIERDTKPEVSKRLLWAVIPAIFMTACLYIFTHYVPVALDWPYAYATLAVLTLPPVIVLLFRNPQVFKKISVPILFFVPMHLSHEVTSLLLGQWYFPGEYFALVPLPGDTGVPVEEFIIWVFLGSMIVLAYYELYVDDGR